MPGELWREQLQIGKEVTAGTGVAATRIMYCSGISFTRARNAIPHKFATGTRDNVRAFTQGPVMAGGQVKTPVSADELIEWLLLGIQGGVSPTTPAGATNARLWTFKPGTTLDSATLERNDGANNFQLLGVRSTKITIAGSVGGTNDVTVDLFAQERNDAFGALTGALSSRTPTFMEGWQTRLWLSAIGGGIGGVGGSATGILLPPCMINWNVSFDGGLGRKYTAANTLAAYSVTLGELTVTASLQLEASVAASLTELTNWSNTTGRQITLEFLGPKDEIEVGANAVQTINTVGSTAGNFTITWAGQTTAPIVFSATAAAIQTALLALPNITIQTGNQNVNVTGGPTNTTNVTVTFVNDLSSQIVPLMTLNTVNLTGGATNTIGTTTAGRSGRRYLAIDLPGYWTTPDPNQSDANTRTYTFPFQYTYDPTLAAGIQVRAQTNRTTAY